MNACAGPAKASVDWLKWGQALLMRRLVEMSDALARINADSALQTEICSVLESLADRLPDTIDAELVRRLEPVLDASWAVHAGFQEEVIFPILKRCHASSKSLKIQINQLETEHVAIADAGLEIREQFQIALNGAELQADMFGYMLRGAFQERRRHLDSEQRLFSTRLPTTLAPVDRDLLRSWLSSHAWPRELLNCPGATLQANVHLR
jgi:hemerythrin-like domain-containing protein